MRFGALVAATLVLTAPIAAQAAAPSLDATRAAMLGKWRDKGDDPGPQYYWLFNADGTYDMSGMKGKWLLFSGAKPPKEATPEAIDVPDKNAIYLELKDSDGTALFYVVADVAKTTMELDYIHGAGNGFHYFTRLPMKPAPRPTGY